MPDSILACVVTYSSSRLVVGPKCDGLYVPLLHLQREITGMLKISQTFTAMPLQMSTSQGLGHFGLLGVSIQHS